VAAISVAVPKFGQQQLQKERVIKHVVAAAQEISAKLGHSGRSKTAALG